MPPLAPADPASERALKASPLVPTLSFAALGLATMVAIGALGLAQHPAGAPDVASPGISVRPPELTLAGTPAGARAGVPAAASVTPVELPGAGLLRPAMPTGTVVPVVDSGNRSAGRSGAPSGAGSAQEAAVAVGRGARLSAGLPGQGAVAGSPGSADGVDRPVAAARKRSTSPKPAPAPQRPRHTPVAGQPTTAPAPKASTPPAPPEDAGTPTPDGTSVVSGPSPVQGPMVMAAKPRTARSAVAQHPTTLASPTPAQAKHQKHQKHSKRHQRSVSRHEQRPHGHGRQEAKGKHDDQAKQGHRDHQAKHRHEAKQATRGKQGQQQHRAGHGHGAADHR